MSPTVKIRELRIGVLAAPCPPPRPQGHSSPDLAWSEAGRLTPAVSPVPTACTQPVGGT